ncbi:hypothetical protein J2W68_000296 [Luteimonas terrae]|uniref:Uncharacterized protein n=1 Tax=Luteimonas terrae TaxID=1530191 RepID=A0ABU1XS58_9GAMM|nr:hypothetical protein [Luteimonas terrae]
MAGSLASGSARLAFCSGFRSSLLISNRAVERAEHRRATGSESSPCLSAASLGCVPRRPRSAGDRRSCIAADRVRRRGFLVPFWPVKKGLAREACESRAPDVVFVYASLFAGSTDRLRAVHKRLNQEQGFRAVARLTFVVAKVSKTVFAGRDPARLRRTGSLCFSVHEARSPNSLRSDIGCSPASRPCDARLALRLDESRARATATATATAKKTAKKTAKTTAEGASMARRFRAGGALLKRRMAGHQATSIFTGSAATSMDSRFRGNDGSRKLCGSPPGVGSRTGLGHPAGPGRQVALGSPTAQARA